MLKETLLVCVLIITLHYNIKHIYTRIKRITRKRKIFLSHNQFLNKKKTEKYVYTTGCDVYENGCAVYWIYVFCTWVYFSWIVVVVAVFLLLLLLCLVCVCWLLHLVKDIISFMQNAICRVYIYIFFLLFIISYWKLWDELCVRNEKYV